MSLICEQIVSEDELSPNLDLSREEEPQEEELDFEEEKEEEKRAEAVDSDKDEGELEDDDDLEEGEVKEEEEEGEAEGRAHQRVVAPEEARSTTSICRFYGRGQCTWGNNCRFVHPTGAQHKRAPPPLPSQPPPPAVVVQRRPREQFFPEGESAWERGLKQAKEMIVRATKRKEEELDFEDKRFHLGVDEQPSRDSLSPRDQQYERKDDEYERRRRLAFESAPWNNDPEPPPPAQTKARANAETFRDPWRRSKSPPSQPLAPKRQRSETRAKRSHSMSSISASGSESSFSGSASESVSESSGDEKRRRYRKTVSEKTRTFKKEKDNNNEYDSWSESLSESEDSMSSYYSESDNQSEERKASGAPPPPKRAKVAPQTAESAKKSPIKMTFLKKSHNLKETLSVSKLNGEDIAAEEEEERLSPALSPFDALSPKNTAKSISSASPALSLDAASTSPPKHSDSKSLLATVSRREELLQQLKAVEDAIARKRSKIN